MRASARRKDALSISDDGMQQDSAGGQLS